MDPMRSQDELNQAGAVIDKAIAFLLDKKLPPVAVASALLGGALGLLAREMSDESILRVLDNAARGVRNGDLRQPSGSATP
ncbi:MAG TPA: hypothetical protein VJY39_05185 [Acidisphaera sp.]|nr:hypothetical protein [Acidisphaera sp.]